MKAMVLAAGLGTRLGDLSRSRPKALVEVADRTLLEITLRRLHSFGITEVIVNVHHFADMVVECLRAHDNFGMRIALSREDDLLLDTGGGLKNAAHFFLGTDEPFVLHNVDVLSNIDLNAMAQAHRERGALATLAVQQRKTSRALLFDSQLALCGRCIGDAPPELVRSVPAEPLAFAGIHIISPRIFTLMNGHENIRAALTSASTSEAASGAGSATIAKSEAFPIIPEYLRLAAAGEKIVGFRADDFYWRDLGTPASLAQAAEDVQRQVVQL